MDEDLNLAKNMEQADGEGAKKGGGMKKVIIIAVVVLLLCAGGGAAYFFLGGAGEPEGTAQGEAAAEVEAEPEKEPIYLPLSPAFVVNFQDQGVTRYLQIELQVMAFDQAVVDKVEMNMPAVRNGLILLFSDQDYTLLNTVEGKEQLRGQVLDSINKVIRAKGSERVQDVFFTGFVMQ